MKIYNYLDLEIQDNLIQVTLNRPKVHNAFNDDFIGELIEVFEEIKNRKDLRLVTLKSRGKSFCAGADLEWMKKMASYTKEENYADALQLERFFSLMNSCPIPILALVHGHAFGGGLGLIATCDYVLCSEEALLGFTEARLGLAPATITPYVINKIGLSWARRWFLSGERFQADEALRMGLVHEVCLKDELESIFERRIESFLKAGPEAVRACKGLALMFEETAKYQEQTCRLIAEIRASEQGQEGMKALLEKRKPHWIKK